MDVVTAIASQYNCGLGAPAMDMPEDVQPQGVAADEMTVEQALAAREAIINQAQNQVAVMEAAAKEDPFSVDLEILARTIPVVFRGTGAV